MTKKVSAPGIWIIIIFGALFFICACSAKGRDENSQDITKVFAEAGLPLLGQKITPRDFSLPPAAQDNSEENLSLSGLKGKVVFLNFWATWCSPCKAEMPSIEALYKRYKEKGLEIIAVNSGEKQPEVAAFMKANKLSFPAALDEDGKVGGAYGIQAIPTTFLIDRDGKIISRVIGTLNWDTPKIRAALEHLLN